MIHFDIVGPVFFVFALEHAHVAEPRQYIWLFGAFNPPPISLKTEEGGEGPQVVILPEGLWPLTFPGSYPVIFILLLGHRNDPSCMFEWIWFQDHHILKFPIISSVSQLLRGPENAVEDAQTRPTFLLPSGGFAGSPSRHGPPYLKMEGGCSRRGGERPIDVGESQWGRCHHAWTLAKVWTLTCRPSCNHGNPHLCA